MPNYLSMGNKNGFESEASEEASDDNMAPIVPLLGSGVAGLISLASEVK